jgi:DNA-binding NtrC family response regulator
LGKKNSHQKPRYILIVEENVHHAELLTEVLDRHFAPVIIHTVDTFTDGMEFMSQSNYDLILTAAFIADDTIREFLDEMLGLAAGTPIIVVTGRGDERLATKLIKKGAADYVAKTREALEKLPKIINKHLRAAKRPRSSKQQAPQHREKWPRSSSLSREIRRLKDLAAKLPGDKISSTTAKKMPTADDIARISEQLEHVRTLLSQ